jgi:hypothetical protein
LRRGNLGGDLGAWDGLKSGDGRSVVSKWSQFEIEQKTTNLAQSKKCAKLMNNKEKVLEKSGSYGWT